MDKLRLYHTGFLTIEHPDIHYGRSNADFGQGFYLSDSEAFSKRWAKQRKGCDTVLNTYDLITEGLNIKRFTRDKEWFGYIFRNRSIQPDTFAEYDVIIGPIANDTLYDTFGIITSGLLSEKLALELLQIGAAYTQIVLKTEKAASQLHFLSSEVLNPETLIPYQKAVKDEEKAFQQTFAERLSQEEL